MSAGRDDWTCATAGSQPQVPEPLGSALPGHLPERSRRHAGGPARHLDRCTSPGSMLCWSSGSTSCTTATAQGNSPTGPLRALRPLAIKPPRTALAFEDSLFRRHEDPTLAGVRHSSAVQLFGNSVGEAGPVCLGLADSAVDGIPAGLADTLAAHLAQPGKCRVELLHPVLHVLRGAQLGLGMQAAVSAFSRMLAGSKLPESPSHPLLG